MTDASAPLPITPLTRASVVVVSPDQVSADLANETIILGMRDGVYYGLSDVGARIWSLAAEPTTLGAIHEALVAAYEVEPATAWDDLVALAGDLLAAGLLVLAAQPTA